MQLSVARCFALAKKFALGALLFALSLVLCELGARGWMRFRGSPYDRARVERSLQDAAAAIADFAPEFGRPKPRATHRAPIGVLHPFTGSELAHDTGGVLAHFRNGVPANEYSVVIVGGSVAFDIAISVRDVLEQALERALPGRVVHVLNYAHPAYKEPQQLTRLAYLLSFGYRPDAVINIDGFSEIAVAYENAIQGTNPSYPSFSTWGELVQSSGAWSPAELDSMLALRHWRDSAREFATRALKWNLHDSCIGGLAIQARLDTLLRRRSELDAALHRSQARFGSSTGMNRQVNGPEFMHGAADVFDECARNWYESVLSIQALCEARNITYLHVLQPTLYDPGSKPMSAEELALPSGPVVWKEAIAAGYPILRARAAVLERSGVHFLDASQAFADVHETLYVDACRFTPRGAELLGQKIAAHFVERELSTTSCPDSRDQLR
jgi:hypothetical protein